MELYVSEIIPGRGGHETAYGLLSHVLEQRRGIPCPRICYAPSGKPFFVGINDLFFSISHTKTHVLVALSDHDVGADIETHRDVPPRLRDRLFTPEQLQSFDFFEAWTLREAVFKLTGEGGLMTMPLTKVGRQIVTPFPDVRCRSYDAVPGCTVSVACREGCFPDGIEFVDTALFSS